MAKKIGSGGDPILSLEFFISGFYTYRSQLFAPFKGVGINVISFRDPVLDGANFEIQDTFQWQRRPGFSIFCSEPLPDNEIVNQFYFARDLHGDVVDFVDTNARLSIFDSTTITTLLPKSPTAGQGYIEQVGQRTYFADGAADDLSIYDGSTVAPWGLAAPNTAPTVTGMGFWQEETSFALGTSLLDPNGNVEVVTAILNPNGTIYSPASAENMALAGSLTNNWIPDPVDGGYYLIEGYDVVQEQVGYSGVSGETATTVFNQSVTPGNVIIVEIGATTANFNPSLVSVTDNLGNTYAQQAYAQGVYHGGSSSYPNTVWIMSAPVTTGGACAVSVQLNTTSFQVIVREVAGISATASTTNNAYTVNGGPAFNTGTIGFTGTQFVLSTVLMSSPFASSTTPPVGYTAGAISFNSSYLADAYFGEMTTASPTWGIPTGDNLTLGISVAFPITSLATGYTKYLFLYDWAAAVPSGATIVGVVLNLPKQNLAGGAVQDYLVKMVIGGTPTGTDHSAVGAWSTTGFMTAQYGTAIDTWGASPTAADINASGTSGFGFVISANITDTTGGSVVPEVGFTAPNNPTLTVYYKQANGLGGPGVSGVNEPIWAVTTSNTVNDGGLAWTNYGPIQSWYPATAFTPPTVVLDANSFLELSTSVTTTQNPNYMGNWDSGATYAVGDIVYFGGQYWLSLQAGNTGIPPSTLYTTSTEAGGTTIVQPWWAITESPFTTGLIAPVWSLVPGQTTGDGSFLWTNIGQGSQLASVGYGYVYAYRTIFGHLSTASPVSANTGAILGPLNATISEFAIDSGGVVTFTGANNFLPGNIFQVQGLTSSAGTALNNFSYTVISAVNSETFPLTEVAVSSGNVATITAINNLGATQTVTFSGVQTASFLNGQTVTVLSASGTQFTADIASGHASYGPTADAGNVEVIGSYTAQAPASTSALWPTSAILDSGVSVPLIASLTGFSTASTLCNSIATITNISLTANIVTVTAVNYFQPGLYVTLTGLTGALFLNNQQVQVTAVDQIIGTENTYFQFYFDYPNYASTPDTGIATFNAVEIYRTSDGGGTYLFDGAVTNPILPAKTWMYNDFVVNADLDIEQIAPLAHLNDPPPGAPGSTITTSVGTILRYWQGRLWMAVGNYVYFSAGPDCTNGIPEEAWPPAYRFQFVGQVFALEETADGTGLLVYLADRVNQILGGPDTISFYPTDALSNFGISNPNAIFRDGSIIGQLVTQKQYMELIGPQKQDIGEHIADYLAANFNSADTYVTMHRDGLDVGVFLSNGTDTILRYGSNISAWSVPAFPAFGAGALNSIETSVGTYSLMLAAPSGGKTGAQGPVNPGSGVNVATSAGPVWLNPGNIVAGSPSSYATVTFTGAATSQTLRASIYALAIPATAVVQGVTLTLVGKQSTASDLTVTVTPTNAPAGALSSTFAFGTSNTTQVVGGPMILWGMPWGQPGTLNNGALSFDITATNTGGSGPEVYVAEVQVTVTYQNPGNYLYARDVNSWGDAGVYGQNNGTPYDDAFITLGNITLTPPGAQEIPLQHIVGYFDAVGTLNNGGPSVPNIWVLPNELSESTLVPFVQLPEVLQEPPEGQNHPSQTMLALRWPMNMANSQYISQFVHHLQVRIAFEGENAPNTIKALSFKEMQI